MASPHRLPFLWSAQSLERGKAPRQSIGGTSCIQFQGRRGPQDSYGSGTGSKTKLSRDHSTTNTAWWSRFTEEWVIHSWLCIDLKLLPVLCLTVLPRPCLGTLRARTGQGASLRCGSCMRRAAETAGSPRVRCAVETCIFVLPAASGNAGTYAWYTTRQLSKISIRVLRAPLTYVQES